jgi:hypothetical protein
MRGLVVTGYMNSKRVWIEGCALGVLLSLLSVVLLSISDATLLGAYAFIVLLVSTSRSSSERDGLFLGLFVVIGESATDLIYFLYGGLQPLLVPYAVGFVLFVGRIPVFPLVAAIGGYLGRQYFAERTKPRSRPTDRRQAPRKSKVRNEDKKREDLGKETSDGRTR